MDSARFTLIGPGRAGRSIAAAMTAIGWEHVDTFGRHDEITTAADGVDVCVVATPDSVIADVAGRVRLGDAVLMHLSGATQLDVLRGHRAASLHPLVSLADPSIGAEALRSAWFAVAGDPVAQRLAEDLSGKWFVVGDENRALYHGAAAIAANHLVALLGQVERIAHEIDVPFDAFIDLVRSSVDNAAQLGTAAALTGPIVRGDEGTIQIHRDAIAARLPSELAGYDAMLAEARRLLPDPKAD